MAKLNDQRVLCLFSILCFGKLKETPFTGKGCQAYNFNSDSISVACKNYYQLDTLSSVGDIHTLLLDGVTSEDFNLQLIDLPFKHLIIHDWDMSNYFKDSSSTVFTLNRRQSLTAIQVSNLQAWRWSDYKFEQMYIERSDLTQIGSQRLSDLLAKRLFSQKLTTLYIIDCQLLSIDDDVFNHTSNLKILTISHNSLSSIKSTSFPYYLNHLWLLDLSYNSLSSLSQDLFQRLPALVELNLNHNHLTNLPHDLLKPVWFHLNLIQLLENQLYCSNFCWSLQKETFPHPISFDHTNCKSDYFNGILVGHLNNFISICYYPWNILSTSLKSDSNRR